MSDARTLVVHTGGIGDFLLACPAIALLNAQVPVDLLGDRNRLELAVAGGIARAAHDTGASHFHTVFAEPSQTFRAFVALYDRVIVWMSDEDGLIEENLRECGVNRVETFPGLPPEDWKRHASEYFLECLGLPEAPPLRLDISPSPEAYDFVIHPGSGDPKKNWPLDNFLKLAKQVEAIGHTVRWCLGPAERERGDAAFAGVDPERCLETDSLVELAARLANTRMYIGNDSGITHLAAGVGCATIALFDATNPTVWAPRGPHVRVADVAGIEFSNLLNTIAGA